MFYAFMAINMFLFLLKLCSLALSSALPPTSCRVVGFEARKLPDQWSDTPKLKAHKPTVSPIKEGGLARNGLLTYQAGRPAWVLVAVEEIALLPPITFSVLCFVSFL